MTNGSSERSIFRPEALAHYRTRREETPLPRLVRPSVFRLVWTAAALIACVVVLLGTVRMPVNAPGDYVWVASGGGARAEALLLLPERFRDDLRPGQRVFLDAGNGNPPAAAEVVTAAAVLGPHELASRYPELRTPRIDGPRLVAVAHPDDPSPLAVEVSGATGRATVRIGSRRLAPLVAGRGDVLPAAPNAP